MLRVDGMELGCVLRSAALREVDKESGWFKTFEIQRNADAP